MKVSINHFASTFKVYLPWKPCGRIADAGVEPLKVDRIEAPRARTDNGIHALPQQSRVIFLGTGSAMPSKYRNVSAIYFEVDSGRSVLMDVGENTYGQLYRRFGTK